MGAAGISFLPHELLKFVGVAPVGILPGMVQVLAALLTDFVVGALAIVKAAFAGGRHTQVLAIAAAVDAIFAIAFALHFFRSPVQAGGTT
jgi:hypothetical protein